MDRAVSALLAALIVLASAGAVVGVAPPGADQHERVPVEGVATNTTDVLVLDTVDAATFARGDLVVTRALAAQSGTLVERYERERLQAALKAADSPDERRSIVHNATLVAQQRTQTLLDEERAARTDYLENETSAAAYLATLGQLHVRARALEQTIRSIETVGGAPVDTALTQRLRADLQTLQGPVRARLADAIRGDGPSARLYVAASEQGVTLATIEGEEYVREVVRTDNRDEAVGDLDFDEAESRFGALYPWASKNKQRISMGALGADVYVVEYTHTHGTIDAYLDASTDRVYREVQRKSLSATPVDEQTWTHADAVRVGLSRTYAGGPVRVNVTNATGAPIEGVPVQIDGTDVGTTNENGVVWAVSPFGSYPVTVSTSTARVEVMVDPATDELGPVEPTTTEG